MTTTTHERLDEQRWQAVQARDAAHEGEFVYAVSSTGVYCRATCPSRRPLRARVRFFDTTSQAREAGYRPCLRCHPDDAPASDRLALQVKELIDGSEEALSLAALAEALRLSPSHLLRVFKGGTGMTPRQYGAASRTARLRTGLRTSGTVTDALYNAGFGSSRGLYASAGTVLGMTPSKVRRRGRGERIAYAFAEGPLGLMLVAGTERGICFVGWGEAEQLYEELRGDFAEAELLQDSTLTARYVAGVQAVLRGDSPADLPLDVQGTPFQIAVWSALLSIPAGETRTYAELAVEVGLSRGSARAVGRACALNRVALLVPCHRAVGHDGSLTGYRWGTERKRALLGIEQGA